MDLDKDLRRMLCNSTFFIIIYHLLHNKEIKKQKNFSVDELEKLFGYSTRQFGGIRKYIQLLVKHGYLYIDDHRVLKPLLYAVNRETLDKLFIASPLYTAVYNNETAIIKEKVILPAELSMLRRKETNNEEKKENNEEEKER